MTSIVIDSFTISIFAAFVLKIMLDLLTTVEHHVKDLVGRFSKFLGYVSMWVVLFLSKFVILEVIDVIFGEHVELGKFLDVVFLIITMMVVRELVDRAYRALGGLSPEDGVLYHVIELLKGCDLHTLISIFGPLPPEVIAQVVEKFVFQLEAQLGDRNITIELSPEANEWLAEKGYDDKFGARPLARVIQEHVKKPLAEEILFGALKGGGTVRVVVKEKDGEKELAFDYIKADTPLKPRKPEARAGNAKATKSRAKKSKKPRGGGAKSGSSSVPKVPLGED